MTTAAQRQKAEAKAAGGGKVRFRNATYTILPFHEWDKKATSAMREHDYDTWAQGVMSKPEYIRWDKAVKTNADCMEFVQAWADATGEDPGESDASPSS